MPGEVSSTSGENDCAQSSNAACADVSCDSERGRRISFSHASNCDLVAPISTPVCLALSFSPITFSSGGRPVSTAILRARNSGSKRMIACTGKSGMKIQANMGHQVSGLGSQFSDSRSLSSYSSFNESAFAENWKLRTENSMHYPAQAARLLKLAVDCAGLRSNRERNNSAVISNSSSNSECGNSECSSRFPDS